MRSHIEAVVGEYDVYHARRAEYSGPERIPFRVSPTPIALTAQEKQEIKRIGSDTVDYLKACDELYQTEGSVRNLLNAGKPEIFLVDRLTHYLFVRPDLIVTPDGFTLCEVETSPFGLALAEILNRAYQSAGFETMVGSSDLSTYMQTVTPSEGTIVYSHKTASFRGQLAFLGDVVLSSVERTWQTSHIDEITSKRAGTVYRGFYLSEYVSDPSVRLLLDTYGYHREAILPSLTPYMEEKALLALLWDRRWEKRLEKQLGTTTFGHLRTVIPPTWIVGQEQYFAPGLPDGISSSLDLASVSRAKRAFVLKPAGFGNNGSWSEGVKFLHTLSRDNVTQAVHGALIDTSQLYVVQEFRKGQTFSMKYTPEYNTEVDTMAARVRLTPYFSFTNNPQLIAIKATGCERTDYIHATSSSINTAVM